MRMLPGNRPARAFLTAGLLLAACSAGSPAPAPKETTMGEEKVAVFGGGCFWCLDAVFSRVQGVGSVECGYAGGTLPNPDYEAVCAGETGHAEVCRITYDPAMVSYEDLLEIFFRIHDPTTPNRQGADVGTQYRSLILTTDEDQLRRGRKAREELEAAGVFPAPIVTEIRPLRHFWPAVPHHQDYYARNPDAGYCRAVIAPKLEKLEKVFRDKLKPPAGEGHIRRRR